MNKVLNMTFASSLTNLCELNTSFDTGVLRICYTGDNRNGSHISKKAIENNLKSIYNCPVVCNYNREEGTFGGHDMEVVRAEDGGLYIANITQPVGVIPESSRVWFENFEEEDGTIHEYLYAEVLLWKRQEAYRKIKDDGVVAHSMEITVKKGNTVDGIYYIDDFEFTAFALIGVEPCFESSALEMFSKQNFKQQLFEMMQDLKESFNMVATSFEADNIHQEKYSMEGGKEVLENDIELTTDTTVEEGTPIVHSEESTSAEVIVPTEDKFVLTSNIVDEICRVLDNERVECEWGEFNRYHYADCDFDSNEVYCWDSNDWLLYGFAYTVDGDTITIDFESRKRKKYIIADFDESEQPSPFESVFANLKQKLCESAEWEAKYQTASDTIMSMETEVDELRQFKIDTETVVARGERDNVFAQFEDLNGVEAFENLRENCMEYDIATLEDKCYAIRGRIGVGTKFTIKNAVPKIVIEKGKETDEPYGGIFAKYGVGVKN